MICLYRLFFLLLQLMKALWPLLCFFIAGTLKVSAQHELVVADVETMLPVAGANVQGNGSTVKTDSLGHFSVPDSIGTMLVSHVNYESRLVRLEELSGDTVYIISKLLNLKEVVVFGKGKIEDDRLRELNRRLRIQLTEAQLMAAKPNGNLFGLLGYLIPKKWRSGSSAAKRKKRHEDILREY